MTSDSPGNQKLPPLCRAKMEETSAPRKPLLSFDFEWTEESVQRYESSFLHDLLNSAGGLRGYLELLHETDDPSVMKKYAAHSMILCDSLIDEIEYHRQFLLAESGALQPILNETTTDEILQQTALTLKNHAVTKGRHIEILAGHSGKIATDKVLLSRILVNMTKNAIEATEEGGVVMIGSCRFGDIIRFGVHNSAGIPPEIQAQLFTSQISTKGSTRGIGLFSIRLLGAQLGGTVGFESSDSDGTCFYIDLPAHASR